MSNNTETTKYNEQEGRWVARPHGRREWVWACGCHAKTPTTFWVNSCSTHSLLNK
jgi:hypothetical protein